MNREIKFRGRIVNSKEWAYGSLVVYPDGEYNILAPRNGHSPKMDDWLVEVDTVGSLTGLYDKNGKEIYEGDILRFYFNGDEDIVYVGFNSEVGAWCVAFKGSRNVGTTPLGVWLFEYFGMEVIGNIYDNPELIKEE